MGISSACAIILLVIFSAQRNFNFYFKLAEFLTHWYKFEINTAVKVLSFSRSNTQIKAAPKYTLRTF